MKKDYRKNMTGLQYRLILGIFILGFVLGLVLLIMTFDLRSFMTWAFILWEVLFAITIYCWVDEERYAKYEYYGMPVIFGLFFLMLAAFGIAALVYYIKKFATGDYVWEDLLAAPIALGSVGMFAFFTFRFSLQAYFKKKKGKGEKENHENET